MNPFLSQHPLPGFDPTQEEVKRQMVRVNLAGEVGAIHIYRAQIQALQGHPVTSCLEEMFNQEMAHVHIFEKWTKKLQARPSLLMPLWRYSGKAAGYISGRLGLAYAMVLTAGVEDVIEGHYAKQLHQLKHKHSQGDFFTQDLKKCYEDEIAHKHTGEAHIDPTSWSLSVWYKLSRLGTHLAIIIAKRI
jgi:ubiquinone biosynthesis monooxygenase Coq7